MGKQQLDMKIYVESFSLEVTAHLSKPSHLHHHPYRQCRCYGIRRRVVSADSQQANDVRMAELRQSACLIQQESIGGGGVTEIVLHLADFHCHRDPPTLNTHQYQLDARIPHIDLIVSLVDVAELAFAEQFF